MVNVNQVQLSPSSTPLPASGGTYIHMPSGYFERAISFIRNNFGPTCDLTRTETRPLINPSLEGASQTQNAQQIVATNIDIHPKILGANTIRPSIQLAKGGTFLFLTLCMKAKVI